jgi:hypothetical protein
MGMGVERKGSMGEGRHGHSGIEDGDGIGKKKKKREI